MKKTSFFFALCIFTSAFTTAATRYWVGASNGKWTDTGNWSAISGGAGGAGIPGSADAVNFGSNALVNVDASTSIGSLVVSFFVEEVVLYTATGSTLTILNNLTIGLGSTLIDSTSADVPFNVVLNGATSATGSVAGQWAFSGRVPVSSGNGARFTTQPGSKLTVYSPFAPIGEEPFRGTILFKNNTGRISSSAATLEFSNNTLYVLEDNMDPSIPDATWADYLFDGPAYSGMVSDDAAEILITGNMGRLKHTVSNPTYARFTVNLNGLAGDASLALPNGTRFKGDVTISNTNDHTLTLLTDTSTVSGVSVLIGSQSNAYYLGSLYISGAATKVALGKATVAAPGTPYRLQVKYDYIQSGGNFSLQDGNLALGASTLAVQHNLLQAGGSFLTNSTATGAAFAVEMNGPLYVTDVTGSHNLGQKIQMYGGTIDNGRNMVALRLAGNPATDVVLQSPLQTGRLELLKGSLVTTAVNVVTVTDPGASGVIIGASGTNLVSGPVRRVGNSTGPLMFPTGKSGGVVHPCSVFPASNAASVYQAEYFNTAYTDLKVASPLKGVSNAEYWNIVKVSGADASVQLTLKAAVPGASLTDGIVVAHYTGGRWISERGTFIKPGTTAAGSVMSKPLSVFSPFTYGYEDIQEGPLPISLLRFEARKVNSSAMLNWQVNELPEKFEVLRSTDGRSFSRAGMVDAVPGRQDYVFLDNRLQPGSNYYRLRSLEKDGNASLSKIVAIINKESGAEITTLSPTVVTGQATLSVSTARAGILHVVVTDTYGRNRKSFTIRAGAGTSENVLNLGGLSSGVYYLTGYIGGEKTAVFRFIKQ